MKRFIYLSVFLLCVSVLQAQDFSKYERFAFIQSGDTLPYRILLPENYDASYEYPLVIFLHGRGESGRDNEKQLSLGAGALFLKDSLRKAFPAIVVFPQCAADDYWSNVQTVADKTGKRHFYFVPDGEPSESMRLLTGLADNLFRQYKIKKTQVYVMGLSMGGMGTFELVRRKPGMFAAAVAICGGADPATADKIKQTNWWVFHGDRDETVPPEHSEKIVAALKKVMAKVQFTVYKGVHHNSWEKAFAEPGLLPWLFSNKK
ncbi:MAG: phospholipase [Chitinophagaceae bacterium]|nr:MAG: phospholipase [Chitinophagaceae bacterium]